MKWTSELSKYPSYLHKKIKKGRGIGSFDGYQPWIKKSDFGSSGSATTIQGIVVPRVHHVLSDLEHIYFMLLERLPNVIDIREQWPILHIDKTLQLCERFGVTHGYEGNAPTPFTIDFLVTFETEGKKYYEAKSVKTPQDARDPKVRKRLQVEYQWCKLMSCPWALVKTDGFSGANKKVVFENLNFIREWFKNRYEPDEEETREFIRFFKTIYNPVRRMDELLERTAIGLRVTAATADNLIRFAMWRDLLQVSLTERIELTRPLILRP
ncbi:TnsA endonuclease N-terminal domain-containing protein [Herbaspirillum chlorophenolicum]|uniref:TnsA endonuclease N-terminal domain-containing protein n=1 Tax=Herbaspirillum chlorophenolicum TaxID=211589 RepID=UPI0009E5D1D3|nr:TnsA endonuclease N-terminal domain-containing protein [Herbaspirillum chlorophenolicum]